MRTFILAVTGLIFAAIAACSSYGTSVVEVGPNKTPVASVSITVPVSLAAGQTARATASPKDANGVVLSDRPVTWFTSSASIASVSDSGVISAVAPGTALVSAVSEGVSGQASMAVTPPPPTPIATVIVTLSPSAVVAGQTAQATATLEDSSGNPIANRVVTWESSNTAVATVDPVGTVKAIASGSAMIKATSEGKSSASALSVSAPAPIPVASVSVTPSSATLQVNATVQLSAATRDANNNVLTGRVIGWSSGNGAIATVSSSGLVTAKGAGSISITAASEGQTGSATITVSAPAPVPVATVSVSPSAPSLQVGGTVQLSATTRDASNNVLTGRVIGWSSGNGAIATVSPSGLVTAIGAGSVSITAASEGQTGSATITVSAPAPVPVATVSVSPSAPSLQVGGTVQLSATTRDASNNVLTGRAVSWSSSNTAIATVSTSGLATAVAAGTVQINATSELKIGSATLTIAAAPPPPPPGTWRGNEPAGMTLIDERPFNSLTETDSPHVPFWFRAGGSIVSDPTAPQSPSNVLRATYPNGFIGGSASMQTGVEGQGISNRTFYITWWAKYSSNWFGHLTGVNKQCYFAANGSAGQAFFEANAVGTNQMRPAMVLQSGLGTDATFYPNLVPGATVPRGKWFNVEIVLVGNTAGNSDGTFDWYIDGVHVGHASGLKITTTATGWDRFNFDPIWGGAGDQITTGDQTLDLDDVYLSGKK